MFSGNRNEPIYRQRRTDLFPSETCRYLSPFSCFPFEDRGGIGMGSEPLRLPEYSGKSFVLPFLLTNIAVLNFIPHEKYTLPVIVFSCVSYRLPE